MPMTLFNKKSSWLQGLLWAEDTIKKEGKEVGTEIIRKATDTANAFGTQSEFDKGAIAYLATPAYDMLADQEIEDEVIA